MLVLRVLDRIELALTSPVIERYSRSFSSLLKVVHGQTQQHCEGRFVALRRV